MEPKPVGVSYRMWIILNVSKSLPEITKTDSVYVGSRRKGSGRVVFPFPTYAITYDEPVLSLMERDADTYVIRVWDTSQIHVRWSSQEISDSSYRFFFLFNGKKVRVFGCYLDHRFCRFGSALMINFQMFLLCEWDDYLFFSQIQ